MKGCYKGMSYKLRIREYEHQKKILQSLRLSPEYYEREIKKIIDKLGV